MPIENVDIYLSTPPLTFQDAFEQFLKKSRNSEFIQFNI